MKIDGQILEAINRGIKFALDDFEPEEALDIKAKDKVIDKEDSLWQTISVKGGFVDLDLPSGTLWCKYNVGANPIMNKTNNNQQEVLNSWYGDYFAFGETEPKDVYTYATYKWILDEHAIEHSKFMKKYYYPGCKYKNLYLNDDAAYIHSNRLCVTPSSNQYNELIQNCNIERVTNYNDIGGLHGRLFTSKINGNQLFFPEANIKTDFEANRENLDNNNKNICFYWTSTLYSCDGGITRMPEALMIFEDNYRDTKIFISSECHINGLPIRGVKK